MAWMVLVDHTEAPDSIYSAVGTGQGDEAPQEPPALASMPHRCKLYDDDGELYFTVAFNDRAEEEDEEYGGLYQCFGWGMSYAGSTDLRIKGESIYG